VQSNVLAAASSATHTRTHHSHSHAHARTPPPPPAARLEQALADASEAAAGMQRQLDAANVGAAELQAQLVLQVRWVCGRVVGGRRGLWDGEEHTARP